jgi:sugar lactone lactonase YvrE
VSKKVELFLDEELAYIESPRWRDERLWFSDLVTGRVASVDLTGDVRLEAQLDDDAPSGLGWLPDGRLLIVSMHKMLVVRREHDGELVVHADLAGVSTHDANDMVVGRDGTAYVGNLGSDLLGGAPMVTADLAVVHPDGRVVVGAKDLAVANGSVITPDGETLIVGESYAHRYRAFPIAQDGTLGAGRVWADMGEGHNPDGCTLDADGGIWFANCVTTHVARVVDGGRITATIEIPEPTPWACALGGTDGRTLFVFSCSGFPTTAHPGDGRIWITRVDAPHAGLP